MGEIIKRENKKVQEFETVIKAHNKYKCRQNALMKVRMNFENIPCVSFVTLTMSNKDLKGDIMEELKDPTAFKKIMSEVTQIFHKKIRLMLKNKGYSKAEIKTKIKKVFFRHYRCFELHPKKKNHWHVHIIFNADV